MKFVVYERVAIFLAAEQRVLTGNVFWTWCARVAWVLLPFTAGVALSNALDSWSRGPAIVAIVFLWAAWLAGAIALLAPRPWGFAVLRVVAPVALVTAALADASGVTRAVGVATAAIATVLALGAQIARASANALAYGDEDRYPLTVPSTLAFVPLPLAVAVVALGLVSGPLLLADGRVVLGLFALVAGLPLAALAANSVFSLSRRWFVLVPAGVVIVDPLTLADPVLLPREQLASITAGGRDRRDFALDLRLGAAPGALTIRLREAAPFVRRRG
ncbi:MAG: hypothetical protein QOI55_110, partial [Actinomycetota bacterium]|nr:hypothetical protein [Actinomycetota bacterium]